jgi:hypothetical protein
MSKFNFYEGLMKCAPFSVIKKEDKYVISQGEKEFIINQLFMAYSNGNSNNGKSFIIEIMKPSDKAHPFNLEVPVSSNNMLNLVNDSIDYLNTLFNPFDIQLLAQYLDNQKDFINQIEIQNKNKLLLNGKINIRLVKNQIEISEMRHVPMTKYANENHVIFLASSAKTYLPCYVYMKDNSYDSFLATFKDHLIKEVGEQLSQGYILIEKATLETNIKVNSTPKLDNKNKI